MNVCLRVLPAVRAVSIAPCASKAYRFRLQQFVHVFRLRGLGGKKTNRTIKLTTVEHGCQGTNLSLAGSCELHEAVPAAPEHPGIPSYCNGSCVWLDVSGEAGGSGEGAPNSFARVVPWLLECVSHYLDRHTAIRWWSSGSYARAGNAYFGFPRSLGRVVPSVSSAAR